MQPVRSFNEFDSDFSYFDQNPAEDPFTSPDGYNDSAFQEETKKDLVVVLQQYFTFATMEDLLKLIDAHFE
jgi:hypothetical protein